MTALPRRVNLGGNIIETAADMRPRDPHDFYPTPAAVCEAALKLIPSEIRRVPTPDWAHKEYIYDPGAGSGPWGKVARQLWPNALIWGSDIRDIPKPEGYSGWFPCRDFLSDADESFYKNGFDLVVGNPPYKFAELFVRKSLLITRPGGHVMFLLRLAFLEGQERGAGLWSDCPPKSVQVLSARPSFISEGDKAGKTDATAYAVFVWEKGWRGTSTLGWLDWKTSKRSRVSAPTTLPMFTEELP